MRISFFVGLLPTHPPNSCLPLVEKAKKTLERVVFNFVGIPNHEQAYEAAEEMLKSIYQEPDAISTPELSWNGERSPLCLLDESTSAQEFLDDLGEDGTTLKTTFYERLLLCVKRATRQPKAYKFENLNVLVITDMVLPAMLNLMMLRGEELPPEPGTILQFDFLRNGDGEFELVNTLKH